jgi:hypothetical protein
MKKNPSILTILVIVIVSVVVITVIVNIGYAVQYTKGDYLKGVENDSYYSVEGRDLLQYIRTTLCGEDHPHCLRGQVLALQYGQLFEFRSVEGYVWIDDKLSGSGFRILSHGEDLYVMYPCTEGLSYDECIANHWWIEGYQPIDGDYVRDDIYYLTVLGRPLYNESEHLVTLHFITKIPSP